MMQFAGVRVRPEDYDRLRAGCRMRDKFPPTYEGWSSLVASAEAAVRAAGQPLSPVDVDVDQFFDWCRRHGVVSGLEALKSFVSTRREAKTPSRPYLSSKLD
jgi:hypothetical protein